MWELAVKHFNPPVDVGNRDDRRITAFPIFGSSTDGGLQDRLNCLANRKVPTPPLEAIKAVQPYMAGQEPIGWLHKLVNRDKHRMPLLTIGQFDEMTVTFAASTLTDFITEPSQVRLPRDATAPAAAPALQSNMQMKGEVAIYVTWKDVPVPSEPVDRTLEQIIKAVTNVIPIFDKFFI
jgi:hypothetical protein